MGVIDGLEVACDALFCGCAAFCTLAGSMGAIEFCPFMTLVVSCNCCCAKVGFCWIKPQVVTTRAIVLKAMRITMSPSPFFE